VRLSAQGAGLLGRLAAVLLGATALTPVALAATYSVGGGTITTTQGDNASNLTGSGGPFILQPNTVTSGDTVTVSGVSFTNSGSVADGRALDFGRVLQSSGAYSITMSGSNVTGTGGAALWAQTAGGVLSFDSTGGAANTLAGWQGVVLTTNGGDIAIKTGADTITTTFGEVLYATTNTGSISIDSTGATLTTPGSAAVYAQGGGLHDAITIGGLNGGFASTVTAVNGIGIGAVISGGPINITLASAGSVTAKDGIRVQGGITSIDIFGTIAATDHAVDGRFTGPMTVTLENGSVVAGSIVANTSNDTFRIYDGADMSGARLDGGGGTDTLVLKGTGTGTLDWSLIANIENLQKDDSGAWELTGIDTRSGATTINAGTLRALNTGAFSASSAFTITSGAALDLNGWDQEIASLNGAGTVINDGGAAALLTVGADNASTVFSGVISDGAQSTGLIKTGTGSLTLSGNNTYTGTTTLNGGSLIVGSNTALGDAGSALFIFNGSTVGTTGDFTIANAIFMDSDGTFDTNSHTLTLSGVVTGQHALIKTGAGTLVLADTTASNTWNDGTFIDQGTLRIDDDYALAGAVTIASGAAFDLNGHSTAPFFGLSDLAGSGTVTNSAGTVSTLYLVPSSSTTFDGVIADGAGGIAVDIEGDVTFTGANTYTKGTFICACSSLFIGNGGTTGSIQGDVTVEGTLTFDRSDDTTFGGNIDGAGGFVVKRGAGSLILTGNNSYDGGTDIREGTLVIGSATALGDPFGVISFLGVSTLSTTGDYVIANAVDIRRDATIDTAGHTLELSGDVGGTNHSLTKTGAGTLILSNGFNSGWGGGTVINQGTLQLGADDALGGDVEIASGAFLDLNGFSVNFGIGLTGAGTGTVTNSANTASTLTLAAPAPETFNGVIDDGNGGINVQIDGDVTFTGANSYTGGTFICNCSTLRIGDGGTTGSILGDVDTEGTLIFNRSDAYTFSGVISDGGFGGIVEQRGPGTLTLDAANSYTGGTLLTAGTLAVGNNDALGSGDLTIAPGATLTFAPGGGFVLANNILADHDATLGNSIVSVADGDTNVLSGNISDGLNPGIIEKTGGGTLILGGSNSYTGGTVIKAGTLQIIDDSGLGDTSAPVTIDGGTLGFLTSVTLDAARTVSLGTDGGTIDVSGGFSEIDGQVTGAGKLTVTGVGALLLTEANDYAGGTRVSNSVLVIDDDAELGLAGTGIELDHAGALFNIGGSPLDPSRTITLGAGGGILVSATEIGNTITGSGSLTVIGFTTLSGINDYAGGTFIGGTVFGGSSPGNVLITDDRNLGVLGTGITMDQGTLAFGADMTLARPITLTGLGGAFDANFSDVTITGDIGGTGDLVFFDTGRFVFTGTDSHSGDTYIDQGNILQLGNGGTGGALASGGTVFMDGTLTVNRSNSYLLDKDLVDSLAAGQGTLVQAGSGTTILTGANTYTGTTTVSGGTLQVGNGGTSGTLGSGAITDNATLAFNRSDTVTLNFAIAGSGVVQQMGSGLLSVTTAQAYTGGSTVSAGTFRLDAGGSLQSTAALTIDGGTFDLNGHSQTVNRLSGAGGVLSLGAGTLTIANTSGQSGTLASTITGTGGLFLSSGGLTLTGNNTFSGGIQVAGDLGLGSDTAAGTGPITTTGSVIDYANGFTIANAIIVNSNTTQLQVLSGSATQAGVISQAGGSRPLEKIGGGTLTLSAANTYTGLTTVTAGTLNVTGSIASAVTVASAGTIGGTGTVGNVTVNGSLSPGNGGIGTLNVAGNLVVAGTGTYGAEISTSAADKVLVGGSAAIDGHLIANFAGGNYTTGQYTLLTSTGTLSGTFAALDTLGLPDGFLASLSYDAHNVFLKLTGYDWKASPVSGDYNAGANWSGGAAPPSGTTGRFSASSITTLSVAADTVSGGMAFQAGAPAYVINVTGGTFTLDGAGIRDSSSNAPTLNLTGGNLTFANAAGAGDAIINVGAGSTLRFQGTATPDTASIGGAGTLDISGITAAQFDMTKLAVTGGVNLGAKALGLDASGGAISFGGAISGSGTLLVNQGTVIFAGAGNQTGGTVIASGAILQLGNGATSGTLTGTVSDNGTLVFNPTGTSTFGAAIGGTGKVVHSGSGTTILTASNSYTGTTTVSAGTLVVNGALTNSDVTLSGGTLKGGGFVHGLTATSGSTVAPGNSIGTLSVGNIAFAAGSAYQVEVNAAGQSDLINASGTASLNGVVQAVPAAGSYAPITTYRILNAAGGLNGTFASATSAGNFAPALRYGATSVDLTLTRTDLAFGNDYGVTANQVAAGGAVSAGGIATSLYNTMAAIAMTPSNVPPALDALSGEIHASLRGAAIEDGRILRVALIDQLSRGDDGVRVWGSGFAASGRLGSDGNAGDLSHTSGGGIVGADMMLDGGVRAGLAAAHTAHHAGLASRASRASGDATNLMAYAGWNGEALRLKAGAIFGWGSDDIVRNVAFLSETDTSHRSSDSTQLFADAGYAIEGQGLTLTPHAGLAWMRAGNGAFRETGGAQSALGGDADDDAASYGILGVRAETRGFSLGENVHLAPYIDLGLEHAFDGTRPDQTLAFGANRFTVYGAPLARDAATVEIGTAAQLSDAASLSLGYDGKFSDAARLHAIRARFDWAL